MYRGNREKFEGVMELSCMELLRWTRNSMRFPKSIELYTKGGLYSVIFKKSVGRQGKKMECKLLRMNLTVVHMNHITTLKGMGKKGADLK